MKREFAIRTDHPGGNARVVDVDADADTVTVEQEIRDTTKWWFWWAFAIEGAAGRTVTVEFADDEVVGPWGPAVRAADGRWRWLGADAAPDRTSFRYRFEDDESVRFAFAPPYQLADFESFYATYRDDDRVRRDVLARSEAGRPIPLLRAGPPDADDHLIVTCRHHACESIASYVFEGLVDSLIGSPLLDACALHAVPFVDLDGVENGDQGKARGPHDHNRDYVTGNEVVDELEPIYRSTAAIMDLVDGLDGIAAAIDLHCPFKWGENENRTKFTRPPSPVGEAVAALSARLAAATARGDGITHDPTNDEAVGEVWWAQPRSPTFTNYARTQAGAPLATILETPYFGTPDDPVTPDRARSLGADLGTAVEESLGSSTAR